jgi:hypothetical protein
MGANFAEHAKKEVKYYHFARNKKVAYAGRAGTDDVIILRKDVATISTFLWLLAAASSPTLSGASS